RERHRAAHAPPHEDAGPRRDRGQEPRHDVGALLDRLRSLDAARAPVPRRVERDRAVVLAEPGELAAPHARVAARGVQQDEEGAAVERRRDVGQRRRTGMQVVDGRAVDLHVLLGHRVLVTTRERGESNSADHRTASTVHSPGTPRRTWRPRSMKARSLPITRSRTVPVTSTSPEAASAVTRAPTCTVRPARSSPRTSHSPAWTPARTASPSCPPSAPMAWAQRTARPAASKRASTPSPVVFTTRPPVPSTAARPRRPGA